MAGTMRGHRSPLARLPRLNGVRPRWPEQSCSRSSPRPPSSRLNGVRPRWPEQCVWSRSNSTRRFVSMESGLDGRNNISSERFPVLVLGGLNGVRPRWPEQCLVLPADIQLSRPVSMESGLDGRNNALKRWEAEGIPKVSMESGLDGRNNAVKRWEA